jgi:hypothetical protein
VVCKVVKGKPTSDWLRPINARRELEVHRRANAAFRRGPHRPRRAPLVGAGAAKRDADVPRALRL